MTKHCTRCNTTKSFSDFYSMQRKDKYPGSAGYNSFCKECIKNQRAEYRKKQREMNPNWQRETDLKHNHGITLSQWNDMFSDQNGSCAICETHQSKLKKHLRVDHCHSSEKIRGLLCEHCNVGIGMLKDNPKTMIRAAAYIEKFNSESADKPSDVVKVISLRK